MSQESFGFEDGNVNDVEKGILWERVKEKVTNEDAFLSHKKERRIAGLKK